MTRAGGSAVVPVVAWLRVVGVGVVVGAFWSGWCVGRTLLWYASSPQRRQVLEHACDGLVRRHARTCSASSTRRSNARRGTTTRRPNRRHGNSPRATSSYANAREMPNHLAASVTDNVNGSCSPSTTSSSHDQTSHLYQGPSHPGLGTRCRPWAYGSAVEEVQSAPSTPGATGLGTSYLATTTTSADPRREARAPNSALMLGLTTGGGRARVAQGAFGITPKRNGRICVRDFTPGRYLIG